MSDQTPQYADQDRIPKAVGPVPGIPPTPGIPQIPDTPDMPDLPNIPDLPDYPPSPDIPDTPDYPPSPDIPDTPDYPPTFPNPGIDPPERLPEEPEPPTMAFDPEQAATDISEPEPVYTLNDLRIEALTRAIARYSQTPINYLLRGELYLSLNQIEAAAADFDQALALASDEFESLTWGYANTALIDRAQDGLRQVAHHQPSAPVTSPIELLPDPI